ncbi:hypothetical protein Egran_02879 [Elaphomyces granulatus]|uniref:Amino acid permease/ SLC12A domain-containing protein n=1 Tax=Elaphomyces granulatus TaxID=519963 RepID=A0A232LYV9_9EURO|nr:hypothetical protein Egran_02879 [Elaphomyces granulatus]
MEYQNDPNVIRARRNIERAHSITSINPSQGPVVAAYVPVKKREFLGYRSTCALTLNRIIGSGIFVAPPVILSITGSKGLSLILWLVGGVITWAGLFVYLEYGIQFPLTGGELHYIDLVWTKPRKLMTYMYSIMFVVLSGSHANALVFGSAVIRASTPPGTTTTDYRLQKLFATLLVGVVCLFQSLSRLNYIRFSDAFALYKVSFLSAITVLGFYALGSSRFAESRGSNGTSNFQGSFGGAITSPYVVAIAILDIMRVYAGYENVNFILEEVRRPDKDPHRVYRRGAIATLFLVTFFYLMVNVAFFATCSIEEMATTQDMLSLFFSKIFGTSAKVRQVSGILLCLSSAGNVMSSTYVNTRVKQEIAREGVIPWPEFWTRSTHLGTPGPALLLHWIFSTIFIIATPLDDPNGYLIVSTLFNYSRTLLGVAIGCALLCAPWLSSFSEVDHRWKPKTSRLGFWVIYPLTVIYILTNLFVFIVSWFPPDLHTSLLTKSPIVTSYAGPATGVLIYAVGALYWAWDLHILPAFGYHFQKLSEDVKMDGSGAIELRFERDCKGIAHKVKDVVDRVTMWLGGKWSF